MWSDDCKNVNWLNALKTVDFYSINLVEFNDLTIAEKKIFLKVRNKRWLIDLVRLRDVDFADILFFFRTLQLKLSYDILFLQHK